MTDIQDVDGATVEVQDPGAPTLEVGDLPVSVVEVPGGYVVGAPGAPGKQVQMRVQNEVVQWAYVGETDWQDLISVADLGGPAGPPGDPGADGGDGAPGQPGTDGQDGADGREVELSSDGTYVRWRRAGDTAWTNLVAVADLQGPAGADGHDGADGLPGADGSDGAPGTPGTDGRPVQLRTSATQVQWRYEGDPGWTDLVALVDLKGPAGDPGADGADGADGTDGAPGTSGREVSLQQAGGYVQWRLGSDVWQNLVALTDLRGPAGADGTNGTNGTNGTPGADGAPGTPGREVQLRESGGFVQWRYAGDATWLNLYAIPTGGGTGGTASPFFKGEWLSASAYAAGDVVQYGTDLYQASEPSTNVNPTATSAFSVLAGQSDISNDGGSGGAGSRCVTHFTPTAPLSVNALQMMAGTQMDPSYTYRLGLASSISGSTINWLAYADNVTFKPSGTWTTFALPSTVALDAGTEYLLVVQGLGLADAFCIKQSAYGTPASGTGLTGLRRDGSAQGDGIVQAFKLGSVVQPWRLAYDSVSAPPSASFDLLDWDATVDYEIGAYAVAGGSLWRAGTRNANVDPTAASPGGPVGAVAVGTGGSSTYSQSLASAFTVNRTITVSAVVLYSRKAVPAGRTAGLNSAFAGGAPVWLGRGTVPAHAVSATSEPLTVTLDVPVVLSPGTTYYMTTDYFEAETTDYPPPAPTGAIATAGAGSLYGTTYSNSTPQPLGFMLIAPPDANPWRQVSYIAVPTVLPDGGTVGQYLARSSDGSDVIWAGPATSIIGSVGSDFPDGSLYFSRVDQLTASAFQVSQRVTVQALEIFNDYPAATFTPSEFGISANFVAGSPSELLGFGVSHQRVTPGNGEERYWERILLDRPVTLEPGVTYQLRTGRQGGVARNNNSTRAGVVSSFGGLLWGPTFSNIYAPSTLGFRLIGYLGGHATGRLLPAGAVATFTGHGAPSGQPSGSVAGDIYIDLDSGEIYEVS